MEQGTERRTYSTRLSTAVMDRITRLAKAHSRTLALEMEWALRLYATQEEIKQEMLPADNEQGAEHTTKGARTA